MFLGDLDAVITRLWFNDNITHSLRIIFSILTGEALVTTRDFEEWFQEVVADLGLVEDFHYRYRIPGDINSVFVRGTVGLNMILRERNSIGARAREVSGTDRVPMRQPLDR